MYGAVSFLQITAPEIHDRILAEFMETEGNILVTMHIRDVYKRQPCTSSNSMGPP